MVAGAEVARDPPQVAQHGGRGTQPGPAAADADVETVAKDEVGPPERNADDTDGGERHERVAHALATQEHEETLRSDHQSRIRMTREHREQR